MASLVGFLTSWFRFRCSSYFAFFFFSSSTFNLASIAAHF